MRGLKFTISGQFACFKKATTFDVSTEFILTYDLMPITVLKGIIGAILGYSGLAEANRKKKQPEYMEKLLGVGIGIEPNKLGRKFTQQITNTTGFANKGMTGIIQQELLADVSYTIYLTDEFKDFDLLYTKLLKNQTTFPITLGRKGFNAVISDISLFEDTIVKTYEGKMTSIYDTQFATNSMDDLFGDDEETYHYTIQLPIGYDSLLLYNLLEVSYSDALIDYSGEILANKKIAILR